MENKIVVNKTFLKYGWRWKTDEETCLICQQEFNTACHKCSHPVECVPCVGMCSHVFHMHCVEEWLQNNKNCPMCRAPWSFKRIFRFERPARE